MTSPATATAATHASTTSTTTGRRGEKTWTIAQVSDDFDVTHRTVRHYEDLGLLTPERRGTQRVYRRRDRTRLALILRGKRLGFPLEQIRTIIDLYDAPAAAARSWSTSSPRSTTDGPTSSSAGATSTRPSRSSRPSRRGAATTLGGWADGPGRAPPGQP